MTFHQLPAFSLGAVQMGVGERTVQAYKWEAAGSIRPRPVSQGSPEWVSCASFWLRTVPASKLRNCLRRRCQRPGRRLGGCTGSLFETKARSRKCWHLRTCEECKRTSKTFHVSSLKLALRSWKPCLTEQPMCPKKLWRFCLPHRARILETVHQAVVGPRTLLPFIWCSHYTCKRRYLGFIWANLSAGSKP